MISLFTNMVTSTIFLYNYDLIPLIALWWAAMEFFLHDSWSKWFYNSSYKLNA